MTAEIIRLPLRREAPDAAAAATGPAEITILPLPASRALAVASPPLPGADNAVAATAVLLAAACHDLVAQLDRIGQRSDALRDRLDRLQLGAQEVAAGGDTIIRALRGLAAGALERRGDVHG